MSAPGSSSTGANLKLSPESLHHGRAWPTAVARLFCLKRRATLILFVSGVYDSLGHERDQRRALWECRLPWGGRPPSIASEAKPSMPPLSRALRLACDLGEMNAFAALG